MSEQNTCVKPQEWYEKYYSDFLNEDDIAEEIETDTILNNYPNNVPQKDFFSGFWLVSSHTNHDYLINHNSSEDNKKALKQCEEIMILLKPHIAGEIGGVFQEEVVKIPILLESINSGHLITPQLLYLFILINDELKKIFLGEEYLKVAFPYTDIELLFSYLSNPSTISFDSFTLDMDQVIDLIKKNERWQKIERDLTIYF